MLVMTAGHDGRSNGSGGCDRPAPPTTITASVRSGMVAQRLQRLCQREDGRAWLKPIGEMGLAGLSQAARSERRPTSRIGKS